MQLRRSHVAGATLVFCVTAFVVLTLTHQRGRHISSSAIGTWAFSGAPLVTKRMHAKYVPVGKPSEQLVLDADGTGQYLFSNVKAIPLTWTAEDNRIRLIMPKSFQNGDDAMAQGTISLDGRHLIVVAPLRDPKDFPHSWRSLIEKVHPPVDTSHFE